MCVSTCVHTQVIYTNLAMQWISEVLHFCQGLPILLIACKKDLRNDPHTIEELRKTSQRPVTYEEASSTATTVALFSLNPLMLTLCSTDAGYRSVAENQRLQVLGMLCQGWQRCSWSVWTCHQSSFDGQQEQEEEGRMSSVVKPPTSQPIIRSRLYLLSFLSVFLKYLARDLVCSYICVMTSNNIWVWSFPASFYTETYMLIWIIVTASFFQ